MDNINIAEINNNLRESYIHYDPNRVDYTISNFEFELLQQSGNSIWKDVFLATLGIGISTILNGYTDYCKLKPTDTVTKDIFLNFLLSGISLSLCIICFIVWQSNKKSFAKLMEQIKNKPKYKLPGTTH